MPLEIDVLKEIEGLSVGDQRQRTPTNITTVCRIACQYGNDTSNSVYARVSSIAMPECPERCGDVTIPYPFGIGENCSLDWRIEIYCVRTSNPPKPFLYYSELEVLNISVLEGTIQVKNLVFKDCTTASLTQEVVFLYNPFTFSATQNLFTAMGCNNLALMKTRTGSNLGGCMSFCDGTRLNNTCFGINCCQTIIPPSFWNFSTSPLILVILVKTQEQCKYAFIVDKNWFTNLTDIYSVQKKEQVPAMLDWNLNLTDNCYTSRPTILSINRSVCGRNTNCINRICSCKYGYEGNPYLPHGCQDINECAPPYPQYCQQICYNTSGGYHCLCNSGWEATGMYNCTKTTSGKKARIVLAIASCTVLGVLLVLAATWWLCKVMKRRKILKLEEKNFKKNGGLLLCQQVSSSEGNVDTTKLFTSKELDMATDHYNKDRILGQGGQDVPLLVYEFIPNGTLFEYIHDYNEDFPLTWDIRVRVAIEIAGALFYLHSVVATCYKMNHMLWPRLLLRLVLKQRAVHKNDGDVVLRTLFSLL
ncbi:Wall-associated receptor kinase-like 8 [Heracleum sosnowskyi]|uniref:Wall-associated receptor kinase-like 8 n=1 Tax=Heracleum sosnowskyi TaxID=360622 RepID=A0AAD8JFQ5_9APIA|nr:Wall-associated receptor kinase-like 8 [Heracleum sosnowskyi]